MGAVLRTLDPDALLLLIMSAPVRISHGSSLLADSNKDGRDIGGSVDNVAL